MRHTKKCIFFFKMQFWLHCYTVGSYQALFKLSVYKNPAVYLLGAKILCFCTINDKRFRFPDYRFQTKLMFCACVIFFVKNKRKKQSLCWRFILTELCPVDRHFLYNTSGLLII